MHILASKKKIDFLKPLEPVISKKSDLPKLCLHLRNKVQFTVYGEVYYIYIYLHAQNDSDVENFQKIVKAIKSSKNVSCAVHSTMFDGMVCLGP